MQQCSCVRQSNIPVLTQIGCYFSPAQRLHSILSHIRQPNCFTIHAKDVPLQQHISLYIFHWLVIYKCSCKWQAANLTLQTYFLCGHFPSATSFLGGNHLWAPSLSWIYLWVYVFFKKELGAVLLHNLHGGIKQIGLWQAAQDLKMNTGGKQRYCSVEMVASFIRL